MDQDLVVLQEAKHGDLSAVALGLIVVVIAHLDARLSVLDDAVDNGFID